MRAPLLHLYFELIHPFWDGNGRVGRVLEASVLLAAGYQYAIVSAVLDSGAPLRLETLRQTPWYRALYLQRSDKTQQRDWADIQKKSLVRIDDQGRLWPDFLSPGNS